MSEPIHIAHIIYKGASGGMGSGVVKLENPLDSRFVDHGISPTDTNEFRWRITNPEVWVRSVDKWSGKNSGSGWRLRKLLSAKRINLVHRRFFGIVNSGLIVANDTGLLYSNDDDEVLSDSFKTCSNDEVQRATHGRVARQRIDQQLVISAMVAA